jgi:hypothetical protein
MYVDIGTKRCKISSSVDEGTIEEALSVKPGEKTLEGGEIFNDYENNVAIGDFTSASGTMTRAGGRGYHIKNIESATSQNAVATIKNQWVYNVIEEACFETGIMRYVDTKHPQGNNYTTCAIPMENYNGPSLPNGTILGLQYAKIDVEGPGNFTTPEHVFLHEAPKHNYMEVAGNIFKDVYVNIYPQLGPNTSKVDVWVRFIFSGGGHYQHDIAPIYTFTKDDENLDSWHKISFCDIIKDSRCIVRFDLCFSSDSSDDVNTFYIGDVIAECYTPSLDAFPGVQYNNWSDDEWIKNASLFNFSAEKYPVFYDALKVAEACKGDCKLRNAETPSNWGKSRTLFYHKDENTGEFVKVDFSTNEDSSIEPAYEPNKYYDFGITNNFNNYYNIIK